MKTIRITILLLLGAFLAGCGTTYVRLRGTCEIHTEDCRLVRRAHPDGIVEADLGDGPPCFHCLREEALEWVEDQD